jgi:2-methylcitrate dehydratase
VGEHEQWDAMTRRLVDFAMQAEYDALPRETVHEVKRRVIDTFGSALGAYDEQVAVMAREIAKQSQRADGVRIWGSAIRAAPEAAAFTNGVMVRLLDISDTYLGKSRGHPSDMTSGILAVAEAEGASGKTLTAAIALAYDIYCSFCEAIDINSKGWDQPVYGILGCVAGVGRVLGFDREQMANAFSLALAPNMALAQSRRGHLSSWKGCAGPNASRNAVFAAMLARVGFTGPRAVFEGDGGLWQAIGRHEWPLPQGRHMIGETHMKSLPVCYHGQSAVLAALELREKVGSSDIEEIRVETYKTGVMMMGGDPTRWAPATRETADHSLPYTVAVALLEGEVKNESFSDAMLADRRIAALMRKVKVSEDPALTAQSPEGAPGRVTVKTTAGRTHTVEVRYPRGHAKAPMSDADLERKFHDMAGVRLGREQRDALLEALWALERVEHVGRDLVSRLETEDA